MKKPLILSAMLLLVSCAGTPATPSSSSTPAASSSASTPTSSTAVSEQEIDDCEGIASGMYIQGKSVYDIDKAAKKIVSYNFDADYAKLKAKTGTVNFEATIKFVIYGDNTPAIKFELEGAKYYLYARDGRYTQVTIHSGESSHTTSVNFSAMPEFIEPTYGSYVSEEQEQYKVDEAGKRIDNGEDGYVKEKFYLFLDLSADSAKVYVGENNQTHRDTPLHQISNYVTNFNGGGLLIKIPHENGEFNCSLTITSSTEISFVNSSEGNYGDYSCSGTFTLIPKE